MEEAKEVSWDEVEQLLPLAVEHVKAGTDKEAIIGLLASKGMKRGDAVLLLKTARRQVVEAERFTLNRWLPALGGGVAAALAGGGVWGLLGVLSGREFRIVAIGLGLVCGLGVYYASGRKKGLVLQLTAVFGVLVGIVFANYILYNHFYEVQRTVAVEEVTQENGEVVQVAVNEKVPFYSPAAIGFFLGDFVSMLGLFDFICGVSAIIIAWFALKPAPLHAPKRRANFSGFGKGGPTSMGGIRKIQRRV